ncbi:MAG: ArnT family glycosyltransferase [Gammaproteobacteria bacterium]
MFSATPAPINHSHSAPSAVPLPLGWLWLLCAAFLLPGLIGHDPWKQDETYVFGIVHHMLHSGDWVVPTLGGEPFMEKPPLYYISASIVARLMSPWFAEHDAARLATGVFMSLMLLFTGLAARELWGRGYGRRAVLVLIACLGLTRVAHEMINDVPLLMGYSMSFFGLALSARSTWRAGLLLGTGVGVGFLSKGLLEPGMIGLTALLLPIVAPSWRRRAYAQCLLIASVAALPWLLIWPIGLYRRSPELFMDWFWVNNFGRFWGFVQLGAEKTEPWYYLHTIPWQTWPALPLALFTLWRMGRDGLSNRAVQLGALAVLVIVLVLNAAAVARDVYALSILIPLAVLAARAVDELPRRVDALASSVSLFFFGALAVVIWVIWLIMIKQGTPPSIAWLARYLPMDYHAQFSALAFVIALAFTLAFALAVRALRHARFRAVAIGALGTTLIWAQLNTLWLPWIDYAKSYRSMAVSLRAALPAHYDCIASAGLGESQRAMLDYFEGIDTRRLEKQPMADCRLLLVQSNGAAHDWVPGQNWREIWRGTRPGDSKERHRLYQKIVASTHTDARVGAAACCYPQ